MRELVEQRIRPSAAVQRFVSAAQFTDGIVHSLVAEIRTPLVRLDPQRAFGQPSIAGRSVTTSALAEDFRAGSNPADLAELYDLRPDEVEQALRFELIARHRAAA